MLIVFAGDHEQSDSSKPVDTFGGFFANNRSARRVLVHIIHARSRRVFYKMLCCSPPSSQPFPAWQSNEVIDFLPLLGLIHIKLNPETIFYSADL